MATDTLSESIEALVAQSLNISRSPSRSLQRLGSRSHAHASSALSRAPSSRSSSGLLKLPSLSRDASPVLSRRPKSGDAHAYVSATATPVTPKGSRSVLFNDELEGSDGLQAGDELVKEVSKLLDSIASKDISKASGSPASDISFKLTASSSTAGLQTRKSLSPPSRLASIARQHSGILQSSPAMSARSSASGGAGLLRMRSGSPAAGVSSSPSSSTGVLLKDVQLMPEVKRYVADVAQHTPELLRKAAISTAEHARGRVAARIKAVVGRLQEWHEVEESARQRFQMDLDAAVHAAWAKAHPTLPSKVLEALKQVRKADHDVLPAFDQAVQEDQPVSPPRSAAAGVPGGDAVQQTPDHPLPTLPNAILVQQQPPPSQQVPYQPTLFSPPNYSSYASPTFFYLPGPPQLRHFSSASHQPPVKMMTAPVSAPDSPAQPVNAASYSPNPFPGGHQGVSSAADRNRVSAAILGAQTAALINSSPLSSMPPELPAGLAPGLGAIWQHFSSSPAFNPFNRHTCSRPGSNKHTPQQTPTRTSHMQASSAAPQ